MLAPTKRTIGLELESAFEHLHPLEPPSKRTRVYGASLIGFVQQYESHLRSMQEFFEAIKAEATADVMEGAEVQELRQQLSEKSEKLAECEQKLLEAQRNAEVEKAKLEENERLRLQVVDALDAKKRELADCQRKLGLLEDKIKKDQMDFATTESKLREALSMEKRRSVSLRDSLLDKSEDKNLRSLVQVNESLQVANEKLQERIQFLEEELKERKWVLRARPDGKPRLLEACSCPLCLEKVNTWRSVAALDPCGHAVCSPCSENTGPGGAVKTCPMCRVEIKKSIPIYFS